MRRLPSVCFICGEVEVVRLIRTVGLEFILYGTNFRVDHVNAVLGQVEVISSLSDAEFMYYGWDNLTYFEPHAYSKVRVHTEAQSEVIYVEQTRAVCG